MHRPVALAGQVPGLLAPVSEIEELELKLHRVHEDMLAVVCIGFCAVLCTPPI